MTCGPILYYSAGEVATIVLETPDDKEVTEAKIEFILNPEMKQINGFPAPLFQLSKKYSGIYIAKFKLPVGSTSGGTYLCLVSWKEDGIYNRTVYSIIAEKFASGKMSSVGL